MTPRFFSALVALAATLSSVPVVPAARAQRQEAARVSSFDNELLLSDDAQLIVTASKKAQRIENAPAAVTVITDEDIRLSGATSIPDLLRQVPGVDVMEPNQSQSNVSIRGFNNVFANKLLVMVDGRSIFQVGEQNRVFSELAVAAGSGATAIAIGAGYKRTDGWGGRRPGAVRDASTVPVLTLDAQTRASNGGRGGQWRLAAGASGGRWDL